MSFRHSALITGAPSGIGAVYADCFARRGSGAVSVAGGRTRTRAAFQRRFRLTGQGQDHLEDDIRPEERCRERARIADFPAKAALSRALLLVYRAIDEGRAAIRGLHTTTAPSGLEQAFSVLLGDVTTESGPRLRIFVQGKPRPLEPQIQERLFLIGREAVMNALRHSDATSIELEVQYPRALLRLSVRDNGCGINPEAVQKDSDSHWGLRGMRERAENMGARFGIWSRPGLGTEVRVTVPVDVAKRTSHSPDLREGTSEI